jgi:hypothetical protein
VAADLFCAARTSWLVVSWIDWSHSVRDSVLAEGVAAATPTADRSSGRFFRGPSDPYVENRLSATARPNKVALLPWFPQGRKHACSPGLPWRDGTGGVQRLGLPFKKKGGGVASVCCVSKTKGTTLKEIQFSFRWALSIRCSDSSFLFLSSKKATVTLVSVEQEILGILPNVHKY